MRSVQVISSISAALLPICSAAVAQDDSQRFQPDLAFQRGQLEQVAPRDGDIGSLSASVRDTSTDLSAPSGFRQLYRVPGRPDLLMRANGSLYAVFSSSVYARYRGMDLALIPPGTVFTIGPPTKQLLATIPLARSQSFATTSDAASSPVSELRQDYRVRHAAPDQSAQVVRPEATSDRTRVVPVPARKLATAKESSANGGGGEIVGYPARAMPRSYGALVPQEPDYEEGAFSVYPFGAAAPAGPKITSPCNSVQQSHGSSASSASSAP